MKYNTPISHGIEFNLGNGEYHSFSFSILPDRQDLFLNKESLFLYLYEYVSFNNHHINFERKKQSMFSSKYKELFRKDKLLGTSKNNFSLTKLRRHTQRDNAGISFYVTNICGTESLDSTFYVDIPNHKRDIYYLEEVFVAQYNKNLHSIEEVKRIAYNPGDIFKFDLVRIKDEYENKYPTIINEYLSMDTEHSNIFINNFDKRLNHNLPELSKNEWILAKTEKTKLDKLLTDSFISINVPQIFKIDDIKTSLRDKNLYYDDIDYLLSNSAPNIFFDAFLSVKNGLSNNMHINNEWLLLGHNSNELHYIEAYFGFDIDLGSKKIITDDYIQAELTNQGLYYLDWSGISLGSANLKVNYNGNTVRSELNSKRLNINNLSFLGDIKNSEIEINKYFIGINKYYHGIFETDNVNLLKSDAKLDINKNNQFLFRNSKKIYKSFDQVSVSKDNFEIHTNSYISLWREKFEAIVNQTNKFAAKTNKKVNVYDNIVRLDYAYKRPIYINENINVNLYGKGINLYDVGSLLSKGDAGIYMEDVFTIYKGSEAIRTNELNINLDIAPKGIEFDDYYKAVDKYPKGITEGEGLFIDKIPEGTHIIEDTFVIDKGAEPIFSVYNDTWINKNRHDSSMIYEYTWISKNRHDSSMVYDYPWISKNRHDSSMIYDYPWISKNKHDSSMVYENQFVAKTAKDTHMDYYMLNVDEDSKGIYMDKNIHIDRSSKGIRAHDNLTVVNQDDKGIWTEKDFFIGRNSTPIDTEDSEITVNIGSKGIRIDEIEFIDIDSKAIEAFKQIFAREYSRGIFIEKQMTLEEKSKGIWFNNYRKYFEVKREAGGISVEDDVRLNSSMVHGSLDYQGENLSKRKKDTYLPEQYSFVEVMHYDPNDPDPDKPPVIMSGKIDELILPHKDYTYSNFIKKLIYDDGSINWTYVKSYDSTTGEYTVSIPVENPMTIYADIGRDYLDVDVAILEIVMFLIKKVWKDNMYKYIALSAQDSLKHLMVEVDKLLIAYGLNEDQRKEAVRCMQLFRWYAEMSILNNCEYILKFDTTKISVDYYNKNLGDFEDIITFKNMEITDNYIIEPIDETQMCYITFRNNNINPSLPLNLSFRLYNINSSSSISIIGNEGTKSVKSYGQGVHDITAELENRVIVKYIPSGKYQSINIANIVIDNKSIRGFTVKYKGKFGETNTVMQDLLDSMLVVGEASEELKQKLSDVSPVTVAISTMVKYFKLHHENKLKGKRLITKK